MATAAKVTASESIALTAFAHQTSIKINGTTFSANVKLGDQDELHITADNGAEGIVIAGQTSLSLSGGDGKGNTFTLTLNGQGEKATGKLIIGEFAFEDSGPLNGMTDRLLDKVTPDAAKSVPDGSIIRNYSKWLKSSRKRVSLTVGHEVVKGNGNGETGSYCKSICSCCEKGSWLSAWCCISCASCDFFKNPLQTLHPT